MLQQRGLTVIDKAQSLPTHEPFAERCPFRGGAFFGATFLCPGPSQGLAALNGQSSVRRA